ncbi:TPA: hypothetical protein ACG3DQ_005193 [Pseudomonas putida]
MSYIIESLLNASSSDVFNAGTSAFNAAEQPPIVKRARVNFQITFAPQTANSLQAQTLPDTGQAGASKRGNIGAV